MMKEKNIANISVIIPTLNRPIRLLETIKSFEQQPTQPREIIVVDQSDKEIFEKNAIALQRFSLNIKHVFCSERSSTLSRNVGIKMASENIIIFSDDDIDLLEDSIKRIKDYFESGNVALVAGYDKTFLETYRVTFRQRISAFFYLKPFFNFGEGKVLKSLFGFIPVSKNDEAKTNWAMGYFFAVRKDLLEKYGILFDEELKQYGYAEDLDFSYRYCTEAQKDGLSTFFSRKIIVHHAVSVEHRGGKFDLFLRIFINRRYLSNKLFGKKMIQKHRLHVSNIGYLKSLKRTEYHDEACKAYLEYKKVINDIDCGKTLGDIYDSITKQRH